MAAKVHQVEAEAAAAVERGVELSGGALGKGSPPWGDQEAEVPLAARKAKVTKRAPAPEGERDPTSNDGETGWAVRSLGGS